MQAAQTTSGDLDSKRTNDSPSLDVPALESVGRAPAVLIPALAGSHVRRGLGILRQAYEYAADVDASPRQFAVKLAEARLFGLSLSDLRWLVLKGLVEPLIETTLPNEGERSFRVIQTLQFPKRTAFVLTPAGFAASKGEASRDEVSRDEVSVGRPASREPVANRPEQSRPEQSRPEQSRPERSRPERIRPIVPHWDADLQELRLDGLLLKRFKVPAPNQEIVLSVFQEEGWPVRIDDPLPPAVDQNPKRRLHDTIVSLNRTLRCPRIRFLGDGSGEGIRWTTVE
jgi:hypothetical protein